MEELDFEIIDDNADEQDDSITLSNEDNIASDNKSKEDIEDNRSSSKSNKSNWKKVVKTNKALIAENKKLQEELAKAKKGVSKEDSFDDSDDEEDEIFDKTEFRFFLIENPEAKEFSKEIESIINNYPNLSFDDALALAKAKQPKQSVSSDDFSTRSVNTKVRKRLSDLTEAEALKLDNAQYLKWARAKGVIQ